MGLPNCGFGRMTHSSFLAAVRAAVILFTRGYSVDGGNAHRMAIWSSANTKNHWCFGQVTSFAVRIIGHALAKAIFPLAFFFFFFSPPENRKEEIDYVLGL